MSLLLILGPPAVGKMTVGRAIADRSAFRLFHNHHSIEMLLDVFDHGTPPFRTLNTEIRSRVIEEAAATGTDLVFTFVMGMDEEDEAAYLERLAAPYGDDVAVVEPGRRPRHPAGPQPHRAPARGEEVQARPGVVGHQRPRFEADYRMTSEPGRDAPGERLLARWRHLVVDNTDLAADEAAERVLAWLATEQ